MSQDIDKQNTSQSQEEKSNLTEQKSTSPDQESVEPTSANLGDDHTYLTESDAEKTSFGLGGLEFPIEHDGFEDHERDFFQRKFPSRNMHWSVAWSDLMMTMFILFMVMFVYKTADREFLSGEGLGNFYGQEIGKKVVEEGPGGSNDFHEFGEKAFTRIYDFSKLTILEKDIEEFAEIDLNSDKTLRINLTGDLIFPLGSADMIKDRFEMLDKIAIFLSETPYKINVVGHTDNIPIKGDGGLTNWELSTDRACAVVNYLIERTGLPPEQFYVTGHAEYRPVVPNDSPKNRALNRRVEIIITKDLPGAETLGAGDL